ncbi:MAG: hypothetical protein ACJA2W_001125 [Planctomycetota bacterium]|jgi:hypothetical protein
MSIRRRELLALGLSATVFGPSLSFAESAESQEGADSEAKTDEWQFHNVADIGLEGRGWNEAERPFSRLPGRAEELVRSPVWRLAQDTAGMFTSFTTDATALRLEVELLSSELAMPHMPATGKSGIDVYARGEGGEWRWVATAQPRKQNYQANVTGLAPGSRDYRVHLPLYNGVQAMRIGVQGGAEFQGIKPRTSKPIVYYGTSIAQGACASRPGMAFIAQLGRRLDVPILNLGFSGNGRLETEVCDLIAEIDARVFVLDCLPNLGPKATAARTVPFVRRLREQRPDTPIVMVEDRANANASFLPSRMAHHEGNHAAFRAGYDLLVGEGVKGLTYVKDAPFLGHDGEGTVDGSHPTDLGMTRYADALEPVLRPLIESR